MTPDLPALLAEYAALSIPAPAIERLLRAWMPGGARAMPEGAGRTQQAESDLHAGGAGNALQGAQQDAARVSGNPSLAQCVLGYTALLEQSRNLGGDQRSVQHAGQDMGLTARSQKELAV